MKAALILLGFFLCTSVERIGFRKFRFVFRLGVFLVFLMLALLCAGCDQDRPIMTDDATGCQFWFNDSHNISPRIGDDGKQICRPAAP